MDMHKDIEIRGHRYRIGRMSARTGSWILTRIMSSSMPGGLDEKVGASELPQRSAMSEEEFYAIQDHCLSACSRFEKDGPAPLGIMANRQFVIKELEYDLVTVATLTLHSLVFNISPFFTEGGLNQILSSLNLERGLFQPSPLT